MRTHCTPKHTTHPRTVPLDCWHGLLLLQGIQLRLGRRLGRLGLCVCCGRRLVRLEHRRVVRAEVLLWLVPDHVGRVVLPHDAVQDRALSRRALVGVRGLPVGNYVTARGRLMASCGALRASRAFGVAVRGGAVRWNGRDVGWQGRASTLGDARGTAPKRGGNTYGLLSGRLLSIYPTCRGGG